MKTKIRGNPSNDMKMILGQIRKVFDPCWIQVFDNGRFTIQFKEEHASKELIRFADMYGYELQSEHESSWKEYHFE